MDDSTNGCLPASLTLILNAVTPPLQLGTVSLDLTRLPVAAAARLLLTVWTLINGEIVLYPCLLPRTLLIHDLTAVNICLRLQTAVMYLNDSSRSLGGAGARLQFCRCL